MMRYLVKEGLFESSGGVITCFKLARRLTQSMTSNPQMRVIIDGFKSHDSVMTQSDKVMQDQITLDQTREEEINPLAQPEVKPSKSELFKVATEEAFNYFWSNMGLTKNTKIESRKEFAKATKKANKQNAEYTPMMFAKFLVQDSTTRATNKQMGFESLGVSRYIKNERWADDHKVVASQSQPQERTQAETNQFVDEVEDLFERSKASQARKLARESKS